MNNVLEYAIDNQHRARLYFLHFGIPHQEVADVGQDLLLNLFRANPRNVESLEAYWFAAARSTARTWLRRRRRALPERPLRDDYVEDPSQDPEAARDTREQIARAMAMAKATEREAIIRILTEPKRRTTSADRVRIHRFRRRLQGAVA